MDVKTTQDYIGVLDGSTRAPVSVYEPSEVLARDENSSVLVWGEWRSPHLLRPSDLTCRAWFGPIRWPFRERRIQQELFSFKQSRLLVFDAIAEEIVKWIPPL